LSYAPTVGILAGRTNKNYSIRLLFSLASFGQAKSAMTFIVVRFLRGRHCGLPFAANATAFFFSTKMDAACTKQPEAGVAKCPVRDCG